MGVWRGMVGDYKQRRLDAQLEYYVVSSRASSADPGCQTPIDQNCGGTALGTLPCCYPVGSVHGRMRLNVSFAFLDAEDVPGCGLGKMLNEFRDLAFRKGTRVPAPNPDCSGGATLFESVLVTLFVVEFWVGLASPVVLALSSLEAAGLLLLLLRVFVSCIEGLLCKVGQMLADYLGAKGEGGLSGWALGDDLCLEENPPFSQFNFEMLLGIFGEHIFEGVNDQ